MNKHEQKYHLIEQYLNDELSGDALIQFENELANNPELANEVEMQQLTRDITIQANNFELRTQIKSGINQFDKQQNQRKYIKYGIIGLALLVGLTSYFFFNKKEKTIGKTPVIEQKVEEGNTRQIADSTEKIKIEKKEITSTINPIYSTKKETSVPSKELEKEEKSTTQPLVEATQSLDLKEAKPIQKTTQEPIEMAQKAPVPLAIDCDEITITAQPKITPPCVGESNGKVVFSQKNIDGGIAPYTIQYKNEVASEFKNFFVGFYNFTISDKNGCSNKIEIEIEEKECLKTNHTLNLTFETEIVLFKSNGASTKLTIFDKNGLPIFEKTSDEDVIWRGTNSSGDLQRSGLYYYIIKSNNETINGQVTILN